MKKQLTITCAMMLLASCNVPLPDRIDFAISEKIVTVPQEGGEAGVMVYTNETVVLTPCGTPEWMEIMTGLTFSGDSELRLAIEPNEGLRRSVSISADYKNGMIKDTVCFRQEGIQAELTLDEHSIFIDSRSAQTGEVAAVTNIAEKDIEVTVSYLGSEKDWIESCVVSADKVTVSVRNASFEKVQRAVIELNHTDGWGEKLHESISVLLSDKDGKFGEDVGYEEVRAAAGEDGAVIREDWIIKGIVVSDCTSRNMEMNPNTDYNKVDTTPSDKTAYIESIDGKFGFRIVFDNASDNTLRQKNTINLYLNSLTLLKETEPERYTITGVKASSIEKLEDADALPVKEKKISELTDEDIYTFVELTGTEFLNKEGCYANVYDSFTLPADFNSTSVSTKMNADCWASLLIDSEGNAIFAMVNMLCPWRRNGSGVPQGVGKLKGIVVHNVQPRYGDIGRYQIRVVDAGGFAQTKSAGSSYEVYAKWDGKPYAYNFTNYGTYFPYNSGNGGMDSIIPSDDFNKTTGEHRAILYFENKQGAATGTTKAVRPCQSFDATKMGSNGGRVSNRALSIQCNVGGWFNWNKDGSIKSYNGIVAEFPTTGLEGKRMFLYFGFCNGGAENITFKNFPGRWCVEYSTDNGETYSAVNSIESGKEFIHLRSYPFGGPLAIDGRNYYPSYSTGLGQTEHLFEFPSDILGKESVRIRIRPYDTTITTLPEDLSADIESARAYDGISIYQDLRINRINIMIK